jgi:hypothetical protein
MTKFIRLFSELHAAGNNYFEQRREQQRNAARIANAIATRLESIAKNLDQRNLVYIEGDSSKAFDAGQLPIQEMKRLDDARWECTLRACVFCGDGHLEFSPRLTLGINGSTYSAFLYGEKVVSDAEPVENADALDEIISKRRIPGSETLRCASPCRCGDCLFGDFQFARMLAVFSLNTARSLKYVHG